MFTPHGDGRKEGAPPLGAAAGTAGGARIGRALRRGRGDVTQKLPAHLCAGSPQKIKKIMLINYK